MPTDLAALLSPVASAAPATPPASRPVAPPARSATVRGPWLRLLSQVLQLAGDQVEFRSHAERPWCSATFSGSRHTIVLAFSGAEAIAGGEAMIAALPDHEFTVPGQLVADAAVTGVTREAGPPAFMIAEVELLLLDEV